MEQSVVKMLSKRFFAKKLRFISAQEKEKALSLGLFYGCGGDFHPLHRRALPAPAGQGSAIVSVIILESMIVDCYSLLWRF